MSGPSARPRAGHVLSWSNVAYTVPTTRAALSSNALAVVDADSGLEAASCRITRSAHTHCSWPGGMHVARATACAAGRERHGAARGDRGDSGRLWVW